MTNDKYACISFTSHISQLQTSWKRRNMQPHKHFNSGANGNALSKNAKREVLPIDRLPATVHWPLPNNRCLLSLRNRFPRFPHFPLGSDQENDATTCAILPCATNGPEQAPPKKSKKGSAAPTLDPALGSTHQLKDPLPPTILPAGRSKDARPTAARGAWPFDSRRAWPDRYWARTFADCDRPAGTRCFGFGPL